MQNLLRSFSLIFLLLSAVVNFKQLFAQCPGATTCKDAYVFCLDELNGFSCVTKQLGVMNCDGDCWPGGTYPSGRDWWAFVSPGGNVTITLSISSCIGWPWIDLGIWGDCNCVEKITCDLLGVPSGGSKTFQLNLEPCKVYYITMDGGVPIGGCDFTFIASASSDLVLGHINNIPNDIIEPVCAGYCGYKFFVDPFQGACQTAVNYQWTLDGNKVGTNKSDIKLDFPDTGKFILCVTATLSDPKNGSICAQQKPSCTTVKVMPLPDLTGVSRTICYEAANPNPYKWHSQSIINSGIYIEHFKDNNCCIYDSVVQFIVLPLPVPPDVYYITCDNKPYVDMLGRVWSPCRDQLVINLPKTEGPFKCDSSIRLTAINVDISPQWEAHCFNGKVELSSNINILKQCNVGESYEFDYRWYKKSDTLQKTITTDERLIVDTINQDYCLDVKVKVRLGTVSTVCTKTFCDTINESQVKATTENKMLSFCDSALINGQSYYQSTQFTQQLKNIFSCDSFVNTEVNIYKSSKTDLTFNSCDSVVFHGLSYTKSGNYVQVLQNANLCDSTLNLDIHIGKSSNTDLTFNSCDSVNINGQIYKQSGKYSQKLISSIGCDSVLNLELNISESIKTNLSLNSCDSLVLNGQVYKKSGDYTQFLKTTTGCDSTIDIHVIILSGNLSAIAMTNCDSAIINGIKYSQTGNYSQLLKNVNGCDSILNIDLTIPKSTKANLAFSSCDSIIINSQKYYQSGSYSQALINSNSCDSILNLDLTIPKSSKQSFSFNSCDSVTFNGQTYRKSGDYFQGFKNIDLCDSIIAIHVNITNSNVSPQVLSYCDSAVINGLHYNQSGIYTQLLKSTNGCDSTLNIDLTISKSTSSSFILSACDSAIINGQRYFQPGNYTQVLQNTSHCDSALNINLNLLKSSNSRLDLSACDSLQLNGQICKQTGIYVQVLKNANQCDSILTINFTLLNNSSSDRSFTSCDSVVVNGKIYKQSGSFTQTLVNSNQCDSILNLNVNIIKSNSSNLSLSSCDSAIINGQKYIQSGSYVQVLKNANQCDSILNINLDILKSSSSNIAVSSCDSAIVNGQIYKQSGSYIQYLKSVNQCDSILNIQVNLLNSNTFSLSKNACDSFMINGLKYFTSGHYLQKLINSNGCDSTLSLDLIIKAANPSLLEAGADTSICEGEIIKLNGIFSGQANFFWHSANGSFDNPNSLNTNYYSTVIGDERIYLQAADDCKQWLDSLSIHVLPKQIVQVTGDTILNPCKEISFTASGGTNYKWTPSAFIDCLDPPCSRVLLKSTIATRFTISTDGPCVVPANLNLALSKIESDIYLPNVFSPNGDNINDVFLPVFNCEQVDYYDLQIFDRWGNLIFESQNKDKGWNGKYQDQNLNPGVYPYVVQYQIHNTERKVKAGDVTLVR